MAFSNELVDYVQAKRKNGHSFGGVPVYNLTIQDALELKKLARKYQFPAEWLANLINHESAGTFNPAVVNPSSGATGLIQFMPSTARGLGTTTNTLSKLTFQQQLVWVDKYLQGILKRAYTNGAINPQFKEIDLYMAIFYPVSMFNPNYQFPSNVVAANGGIKTPMDYYNKVMQKAIFKNIPLEQGVLGMASQEKTATMPVLVTLSVAIGVTFVALFLYDKYKQ